METARLFLGRELNKLETTIHQIQRGIESDPSANGRCAGMRAMLHTQQRHYRIVQRLTNEVDDVEQALAICHQMLVIIGRDHTRLTEQGGVCNPKVADDWWATLDDMQYLAKLSHRLMKVLTAEADEPRRVNGKG
ncbi:MAG: hypothetical protein CL610_29370 [Anaerolineaceae bacterium]|nr:hypothetical protein [Anaerolineaceae bacterium]